ncbi:hypothetical protein VNO77_18513 [Canavalia gladiata]|uniref:NADP-dependent oxidoreductase domain-containing protein n=1 Tax=Canavalia gladiata TaxID=3824 RepID=A0AAN9LL38_CANGL
MDLTGVYNEPLSHQDGMSIMKQAHSKGITFFDTADMYGIGANEVLVGKSSWSRFFWRQWSFGMYACKQRPVHPPQLALAWGLQQGNDVVPIPDDGKSLPFTGIGLYTSLICFNLTIRILRFLVLLIFITLGLHQIPSSRRLPPCVNNSRLHYSRTTKIKNLDQNMGVLSLKFTESNLREISEAVSIDDVAGYGFSLEDPASNSQSSSLLLTLLPLIPIFSTSPPFFQIPVYSSFFDLHYSYPFPFPRRVTLPLFQV